MNRKTSVIACGVLALDLKYSAEKSGLDLDYEFLEPGLHRDPNLLKEKLQSTIDRISSSGLYDRIIVGFGICGKGTVGIHSRSVPLVIPKVHDCIALFLGGNEAYKAQFRKYPGTYYLSAGWCEEIAESGSWEEQHAYFGNQKLSLHDLTEKYGESAARETFNFLNSWQKHYQRAVFIDTNAKSGKKYESLAQEMARKFKWEYEKIKGDHSLIQKLIAADKSTDDILFVPPDHVIGFDPIGENLSSNPAASPPGEAEDRAIQTAADITGTDSTEAISGEYIKTGLGVDAGGTYTDAVIFDLEKNTVIGKAKSLTTKWDFTRGISRALEKLNQDALRKIELVSLSTTLATNAIVENAGQNVGLIIMPPFGLDIAQSISYRPKSVIQGQLDIVGRQIVPVNPDEVRSVVSRMADSHHVTAFAVSGFAGSINPEHELLVKKIIREETGMFVSCGHELSDSLNFQTRAVTAMLNARIIPRLAKLLLDLEMVLEKYGIDSPVVVVKGDGTLMSSEVAKIRPVETVLSGPAASVAGARHLTGIHDALVVDMGGTTTDTAALSAGMVSLNQDGSNVGGHRTHVQALDIRTTGLGGDSLIRYERTKFLIGPKRVAPIAWLGMNRPGTDTALDYIESHLKYYRTSTRKMQVLTKTGSTAAMELSPMEEKVVGLLEQRPYSLDELLQVTGAITEGSLHLGRLEENFIVQKCGLTFTDLLHINGQFEKWDTETAGRYAGFYSFLTQKPLPDMIDQILDLGVKRLSMELLKRRLDDDMDPDRMKSCPVCKTLVHHLLNEQNPNYEVAIKFRHPVIGIGAPVHFFLPQAVAPFKAEAILPEHADVANAIGAITSHVFIRKQLWIIPGKDDGFIVEGVSGAHVFKNIDEADRFAREQLKSIIHKKALEAGTSCRSIKFETKDSIPLAATGEAIFLKRTISASLKGRPDVLVEKIPSQEN